jgi:hypothetical protein
VAVILTAVVKNQALLIKSMNFVSRKDAKTQRD